MLRSCVKKVGAQDLSPPKRLLIYMRVSIWQQLAVMNMHVCGYYAKGVCIQVISIYVCMYVHMCMPVSISFSLNAHFYAAATVMKWNELWHAIVAHTYASSKGTFSPPVNESPKATLSTLSVCGTYAHTNIAVQKRDILHKAILNVSGC